MVSGYKLRFFFYVLKESWFLCMPRIRIDVVYGD